MINEMIRFLVGTPYNDLYRETSPERGTVCRLQGNLSFYSVKMPNKANRCIF